MLVIEKVERKGTSKKTGRDYDCIVLVTIYKRFNGEIGSDQIWVNRDNPGLIDIMVGDQIRVAQEGGEQIISKISAPSMIDKLSAIFADLL